MNYKKGNKLVQLKFENFKRGIGIAEKLTKQEGIAGVVMQITNPYFDSTAYAIACKMKLKCCADKESK